MRENQWMYQNNVDGKKTIKRAIYQTMYIDLEEKTKFITYLK